MMIEKKIHSLYPHKLVFDPSSADRYNLFLAESMRKAVKSFNKNHLYSNKSTQQNLFLYFLYRRKK